MVKLINIKYVDYFIFFFFSTNGQNNMRCQIRWFSFTHSWSSTLFIALLMWFVFCFFFFSFSFLSAMIRFSSTEISLAILGFCIIYFRYFHLHFTVIALHESLYNETSMNLSNAQLSDSVSFITTNSSQEFVRSLQFRITFFSLFFHSSKCIIYHTITKILS